MQRIFIQHGTRPQEEHPLEMGLVLLNTNLTFLPSPCGDSSACDIACPGFDGVGDARVRLQTRLRSLSLSLSEPDFLKQDSSPSITRPLFAVPS